VGISGPAGRSASRLRRDRQAAFAVRLVDMGRKVRGLWPIIAVVATTVATVWLVYAVWRSSRRDDLSTFGQYALAVAVMAAGLIARAWHARTKQQDETAGLPELDRLADLLAEGVRTQWTRAAASRGLLGTPPINVRWEKPSMPFTGPISAAAGSRQFRPLPGLSALTVRQLREGQVADLHRIYGGLGSGRLVIVGAPGSGKSAAAILLILATLKYRDHAPSEDRPQIPVPVMFSPHGWDPVHLSFQDWFARQLQLTYPLFTGKNGIARASRLLASGKLTVILDGLDEIPTKLRPDALRALSKQATFRVIVLSRSAEMAAAAKQDLLEGAAALELKDIDSITASAYLTNVQLDPAPRGWSELISRLWTANSPIAQALNSPLTLTLVRDTYRSGDDIHELLDFCDSTDHPVLREDIVDHLLDRVLPVAYAKQPGDPPPRYNSQFAQRVLRRIAAQMNRERTRDLLWWQIPLWVPSAPRVIATGVTLGGAVGVGVGLMAGLAAGIAAGVAVGLMAGLAVGLRPRAATGLAAGLVSGLAAGLAFGFPFGFTDGVAFGLISGLSAELGSGFGAFMLAILVAEMETMFPRVRIDVSVSAGAAGWAAGIPAGLAAWLAAGLTAGFMRGFAAGLTFGLAAGFTAGLTAGLAIGLAGTFSPLGSTDATARNPVTSWRSDPTSALGAGLLAGLGTGLGTGLSFGLAAGLTAGLRLGLTVGLTAGLMAGFIVGLVVGLASAETWSASLAFAQLAMRWHSPLRMMRFLEDACDRQVLRTIGPVYQFRHARLQDRLAAHYRLGRPGQRFIRQAAGTNES